MIRKSGSEIESKATLSITMPKRSKQREVILKVLKGTSSHPNAEWIYEQVKHEIPNISFGTVYRNLKRLKEAGEILEHDLSHKPSHFNGTIQEHYHFRCENCDSIFDLDEPVNKTSNRRVAKRTGFKVTHHILEYRGLCKSCKSLGDKRAEV